MRTEKPHWEAGSTAKGQRQRKVKDAATTQGCLTFLAPTCSQQKLSLSWHQASAPKPKAQPPKPAVSTGSSGAGMSALLSKVEAVGKKTLLPRLFWSARSLCLCLSLAAQQTRKDLEEAKAKRRPFMHGQSSRMIELLEPCTLNLCRKSRISTYLKSIHPRPGRR